MKKTILTFFLIFSAAMFAQNSGKLIGNVKDARTNEFLPGVNLYILNSSLGTTTDDDGNFELLNIPVGKHTLRISFVGYKSITTKANISKNKTISISIELVPKVFNMDEVIISGTRYETAAKNVPLSVSVVSAKDLEMKHARSIDDALKNTPGLFFKRSQGLGTSTSHAGIRMRGTGAANRTLVMKDGIPLNSTHTGGVALWSTIGINSIDKIEVIRGAGSAIYGSNAMGGIVNLISTSPTPNWSIGANAELGTFGTTRTGLKLGKYFNNFGFVFSGEYKKFDGYKYMKDDVWKDYYKKPKNEFLNLNARLESKLNPASKISLSFEHHSEEPNKATSRQYDMDSKQNRIVANYFNFSEILDYSISLYYSQRSYESIATKYNKESKNYDKPYYNSDLPEDQTGFVAWVSKDFGCMLSDMVKHKITLGTDGRMSSNESLYSYPKGDRFFQGNQNLFSGFLNDEISITDKWNISLGLRYDWWHNQKGKFYDNTGDNKLKVDYPSSDQSRFSPKIGLVFHVNENSRIRANYGTGFKVPGVFYMFRTASHGTSFQVGNPELKPEIMNLSFDIGTELLLFDLLETSLSYYNSSFTDFIYIKELAASEIPSYINPEDGQKVIQYTNIGKVGIQGLELGMVVPFSKDWKATFNYVHNKSEIKEHELEPKIVGKELSYNPKNIFNLGLQYNNPKYITVGIWLRNTGKQYSNDMNTNKIDGYSLIDLKVQRDIYAGITASVSVYNLLDEEYFASYSSAKSYSLGVPRTILFGISYNY